jgi:hypothetical protein
MRFKDVAGAGAGHDTRGRVCSPECFALACRIHWAFIRRPQWEAGCKLDIEYCRLAVKD